jgi:hypothetical protein
MSPAWLESKRLLAASSSVRRWLGSCPLEFFKGFGMGGEIVYRTLLAILCGDLGLQHPDSGCNRYRFVR